MFLKKKGNLDVENLYVVFVLKGQRALLTLQSSHELGLGYSDASSC